MAANQHFLTREQVLKYRTATTLLSYTNGSQPFKYKGHDQSGGGVSDLQKADQVVLEKLSHFAKLVVRDDEVVALMPCTGIPDMPVIAMTLESLHCGPRRPVESSTSDKKATPLQDTTKPHVNYWPQNTIENLDNSHGVAVFFLRNQSLNFADHCNVILHLLKEHHSAPIPKCNSFTFKQLSRWIVLTSCKGLMKRFGAGSGVFHPWHYLAEVDDEDFKARNRRYETYLESRLSDRLPDRKQIYVMNLLINLELLPSGAAALPIHDKVGRLRFRRALSGLLNKIWHAVKDLVTYVDSEDVTKFTRRDYGSAHIDESIEVGQQLNKFADEVSALIETLLDVQIYCGSELISTLEWIEVIFSLYDYTPLPANQVHPTHNPQAIRIIPDRKSPREEHSSKPSEVKSGDGLRADWEQDFEGFAHDRSYSFFWAYSAAQYLRALLSHFEALTQLHSPSGILTAQETANKQYIEKVTLNTVRVRPEEVSDEEMQPLDIFFQECPLAHEQKDLVRAWFEQHHPHLFRSHEWLTPKFAGSLHPEMTLLSLHALSQSAQPEVRPSQTVEMIQQNLADTADISPHVIRLLKDRGPLLTTSKRYCCPSCCALAGQMVACSNAQKPLICPVDCKKWTPVTLPPWLPQKVTEKLIQHATTELCQRLLQTAEQGREERMEQATDQRGEPPKKRVRRGSSDSEG
ncbi:MAG: hypothetical protein Q9209_005424 [Squamulea sp. 1 TL-2023]